MTHPILDRLALPTLLALLVVLIPRCAGPSIEGAGRPLPAYAGRAPELFDDTIEPAAVGIALEPGPDPRSDRRLRERTQVGDATLRVRVTTITAKAEDSGTGYVIGLRTIEKLAGQFPPPETFEIAVGRSSPSAGILKGLQAQIVGKTFVGFLRTFVRPDGDQEMHFHLAPDAKEEVGAVRDAAALSAL